MKKVFLVFVLCLLLSLCGLSHPWYVSGELAQIPQLEIGSKTGQRYGFTANATSLHTNDFVYIQSFSGTSLGAGEELPIEISNKSCFLPYNKQNFRFIKSYISQTKENEINDTSPPDYLSYFVGFNGFFEKKYLYLRRWGYNPQSYMLDINSCKRIAYPWISNFITNDYFLVGNETPDGFDSITITVSRLKNLFDVRRATFDVTHYSGYDVSSMAFSGNTQIIINFNHFPWLVSDGQPLTIQKTLDLKLIDRKNKKQKYFYSEDGYYPFN